MRFFKILILSFIILNNVFAKNSETNSVEIPELTGEIHFYEENGGPIDIRLGGVFGTPLSNGEYGESLFNSFINNNVEVSLYCTSTACESRTSSKVLMTENGVGSLTIEDKHGRTLTKSFRVWKINKTKPLGRLIYLPLNSIWTNSSKTVTLEGNATLFGPEEFNQDWLVGNSTPSFLCDVEGGCSGTLSLVDSAGNILDKNFTVSNIDKTKPTIHINKYAEIINGKQKVGIRCEDLGGSGCVSNSENIIWLPLGTTSNQCVFDKAGNSKCANFATDQSERDYSDAHMSWTKGNRTIFLNCVDEPGGSGCIADTVSKVIVYNVLDTSLKIQDYAGNSLTKHFQISKIDKELPIIQITGLNNFKATDENKIKISSNDTLSGLNKIRYKWNNTCIDGNNLIGTSVSDGDWINYTISGNQILYVCAIDNVGNHFEKTKTFLIYPGDLSQDKTTIKVSSKGNNYANNSNYYTYILTLKDKYNNLIYGKNVDNLEYSLEDGHKKIFTNMTGIPSGDIALSLECNNYISNNNGEVSFSIKSFTPGKFTERFKISINNWGHNYVDNPISRSVIYIFEKTSDTNLFLPPITGELLVIEGGDTPEIGKEQKYKIKLKNIGNLMNYSNGKLNISNDTIIHKTQGHFWNTFGNIDNNFGLNISDYLGFTGSIDANDNILSGVNLSTDNLIISYDLLGKTIKYYLDDFGISGCDIETLGLKVIGNLQGDGKSDITGQDKNFSDLSKSTLRLQIRMNAYKLIKGLSSGAVVNGVKYIEGNTTISGNNLGYETLIIKNGNLTISGNLNTNGNKLGIIVLKDNYNIESDYNKDKYGNIYVNKNVTNIDAIIYADGAFRSASSNGNSYSDLELNNKLELKGSLFTRNTIGGAVKANTNYLLPGGQPTNDFDLAEIYDLNYTRKLENACGEPSFIIRYNSSIQTNPPIGFGIK